MHTSQWEPGEVVKREDEHRIWQQINTFLVVTSKIQPELHGLDMQKYKHIKIISLSIYLEAQAKKITF